MDVNPVKVGPGQRRQGPGGRGADRRADRRGRCATGALRATARRRARRSRAARSRWSASAPRRRPTAACRTDVPGAGRRADRRRAAPSAAGGTPSCSAAPCCPAPALSLLVPILEKCVGATAGVDFGVAVNPEFLREGTSVRDFFDPPKTVIGELDPASGDVVAALYEGLPGEVFRVPIPVAEMTKYADNAFHALKIGFANELGAVCQALGARLAPGDGRLPGRPQAQHQPRLPAARLRLRRLLPAQGPARPGLRRPAGRRVGAAARRTCCPPTRRTCSARSTWSTRTGRRRVGLFGLSFKPGTDDLRESPLVELAERLFGKGYDLRIYDANVTLSRLIGANREYIESRLPHLGAAARRLRRGGARPRRGVRGRDARTRPCWRRCRHGDGPRDRRPRPPARRRGAPANQKPAVLRGHLAGRARSSSSRTCPCRSTGGCGRRAPTLRDAGWEVHVICPQGAKRDTEPEAEIDGVRIHRYPLRAATGGPAGYLREYGSALWHTFRLARRGRPGRRGARLQPARPALPARAGLKRRGGARFVFDQHDLVPELYLSRFDRGEDLLYRAVCRLERRTYRAARRGASPPTRATGRSRCAAAASAPEEVFVVRSAPGGRPVPPGAARAGAASAASRTCCATSA